MRIENHQVELELRWSESARWTRLPSTSVTERMQDLRKKEKVRRSGWDPSRYLSAKGDFSAEVAAIERGGQHLVKG
ncbi:hypothetical protein NL676_001854 [Syzygium grande]|nr:hypothetical protein NL676_001854 [Syzygium grande]